MFVTITRRETMSKHNRVDINDLLYAEDGELFFYSDDELAGKPVYFFDKDSQPHDCYGYISGVNDYDTEIEVVKVYKIFISGTRILEPVFFDPLTAMNNLRIMDEPTVDIIGLKEELDKVQIPRSDIEGEWEKLSSSYDTIQDIVEEIKKKIFSSEDSGDIEIRETKDENIKRSSHLLQETLEEDMNKEDESQHVKILYAAREKDLEGLIETFINQPSVSYVTDISLSSHINKKIVALISYLGYKEDDAE